MVGRITRIISNLYTVEVNNNKGKISSHNCRARGKFRNEKLIPLVGDMVRFNPDENYILEILVCFPPRQHKRRPHHRPLC